jgi:hypothetical protein
MKLLAFAVLLAFAAASYADGPGSRIRAGPEPQQPPNRAAARDLDRCDALREVEEKERCKKAVRAAAAADEKPRGPEATGMGSGAGASAPAPR